MDLKRIVLFVAGSTAVVLLAMGAFVAWIVVLASISALSWLTFAWLAAAAATTYALVWLAIRMWRMQRRDPPEVEPIRAALKELPPGVKPRRSRAARPGLMTILGWVVFAIGLVAAFGTEFVHEMQVSRSPGPLEVSGSAVGIVAITGLIAGALLSLARDSRGRDTKLPAVLSVPLVLAAVMVFGGDGTQAIGDRIGQAAVILAVTGIPLLVGFVPVRFYLLGRPANVQLQPAGPSVSSELDEATDHGRSEAVLREYVADEDGWALLAEDREALARRGYVMTASEEADGLQRDERVLKALFVRPTLAGQPSTPDPAKDESSSSPPR